MPGVATPDELLQQAGQRCGGLVDLGPDGWQSGLDQFLAAVRLDLADDSEAITAMQRRVVRRLVNRLRIEDWYARHGDEAGRPVAGPVVIVGLPRTATTALQYLLATDPQFRYQRRWELRQPVPPPDLATEAADSRRVAPTGVEPTQHIVTVDGPIEDGPALELNFGHQELSLPLPTYTRWWRTSDPTSTYAYHDRVHRLLHSHRPPHLWLLKAPAYLFHLEQIVRQYPGARFLWTHRDPVAAIPSTCSVVRTARTGFVPSHRDDPVELGSFVLEHFVAGVQAACAARQSLGEERFCDVSQVEFETRPMRTVEQIYEFLGLELSDPVRSSMQAWTAENRRGARGEHTYAPADYGLTPDGIRAAFAGYVQRFDGLTAC